MPSFDLGTGVGRLVLDSSAVQSGVNVARNALTQLEPVVARQWWGIRNVGLAFEFVAGAATAALGEAVHAASQWEAAMTQVQIATGDAADAGQQFADSTSAISDQLLQVAETTAVPIDQLGKLAVQVARLGVRAEDVAPLTKSLANLGQVSDTNVQQATVAIGKLSNELGLSREDAQGMIAATFELSKGFAATGDDILTFTQQIAGAGQTVGLTNGEIEAFATVIASAGPKARQGIGAVTKILELMSVAVHQGGDDLERFAAIAGSSSSDFAQTFKSDAAVAINQFLQGIAKLDPATTDISTVFDNLGISEGRQVAALEAVAKANSKTVDGQTSLQRAIELSSDAFQDHSKFTEAVAEANGTAAAQFTELKNTVTATAISFGQEMLPAVKFVVDVIANMVAGFAALPGPVKVVAVIFAAFSAALLSAAAAAIVLIPRIVIAQQALRGLVGSMAGVFGAGNAASQALVAQGEAASASAAQIGTLVEAFTAGQITATEFAEAMGLLLADEEATGIMSVNVAEQMQVLVAAFTEGQITATEFAGAVALLPEAEAAVEVANTGLAASFGALAIAAGPIVLLAAGIGAALYLMGKQHRQHAQDVENDTNATNEYAQALRREAAGHADATKALIAHKLAGTGVIELLQEFGITTDQLTEALKHPRSEIGQLVNGIISAGANEKGYKAFIKLRDGITASEKAIKADTIAMNQFGIATDAAGNAVEDVDIDTPKKKLEDMAKAAEDVVFAQLNVAQAALQLKQAQQNLSDVIAKSKGPISDLKKAQDDLKSSQDAAKQAAFDLEKAQFNLAHAREEEQRKLHDAEDSLADARDRYNDSLQNIADLEKKINELRSGPTADQLRDATNKLADAQLNLHRAEVAVGDAEWRLNYLRQEGASQRDIQDAEDQLAEARQKVNDQTDDVIDSQEALNKLQQGADPEELAKAERDLERARRDSKKALVEIADKERDLQKIRDDVARDRAYQLAVLDLNEAQIKLDRANDQVYQSTLALKKVQTTGHLLELQQAQLGVQSAALSLAKANAELRAKQDEANGVTDNAATKAHNLGQELQNVANTLAPGSPLRKQLEGYAAQLLAIPDQKTTDVKFHLQSGAEIKAEYDKAFQDFQKGLVPYLPVLTPQGVFFKAPNSNVAFGAEGGLIKHPTRLIAGEHSKPELLLPLTDMSRTFELLRDTGLLHQVLGTGVRDYAMASMAAPVAHTVSSRAGDTFHLTALTNASAPDIADEIMWAKRIRARR